MVKRILENETYLGNGAYPRIINDEDFLDAHLRKSDKITYTPCPEYIAPIRKKTVCAHCGAVMARDTRANGHPRWRCQNKNCNKTIVIDDQRQVTHRFGPHKKRAHRKSQVGKCQERESQRRRKE